MGKKDILYWIIIVILLAICVISYFNRFPYIVGLFAGFTAIFLFLKEEIIDIFGRFKWLK